MRPLAFPLALCGLLSAALAWSAPELSAVRPPASVTAGASYETALPPLPPGTEEVELFLLPDDGSGRLLRLTPEREAGEGPLRWRMPRVAATNARLVLRAGGAWGEVECPPSASFAIRSGAPPGLAIVLRAEAELEWQFGDTRARAPATLLPPDRTAFARAVHMAGGAEETRTPGAALPGVTRAAVAPTRSVRAGRPALSSCSRLPRFLPLLI